MVENAVSKVLLAMIFRPQNVNTLRPRQNGRHFTDDTFKRIFLNENVRISINISLKFVPKGLINNISALVQIMAWRRPGDKPLSEAMMESLLTHICVTRPQWVKRSGMVWAIINSLKTKCLKFYSWHFADRILLNEDYFISLKFALKGPIVNMSPLVEVMTWHWRDNRPLLE